MKFGLDVLLEDAAALNLLKGKRVGLVGHPASLTSKMQHSLDALMAAGVNITAAFGPQHGMRGEKQDNMVESPDYEDPKHGIPVFSLYGDVRRPTQAMLDTFDVLLVDLQDAGTRIYTFLTTLFYLLEDCDGAGKDLWVLDRPNPAGREIEGSLLKDGYFSFVGAAKIPIRHGLTLGEAALWYKKEMDLGLTLQVVKMEGYAPQKAPGFGWPMEKPWVCPSPNAASINMIRAYPGTVLLEGTQLSEGRGTTVPLEVLGAPDIEPEHWLETMRGLRPQWMQGATLRPMYFHPMFQKHEGALCRGFQIHAEGEGFDPALFRPYRLVALAFKALRQMQPDYALWRDFHYEYEKERLAIDLINGGPDLREWVDSGREDDFEDFERLLQADEAAWAEVAKGVWLY